MSVGVFMGGATTWSAQGRPISVLVDRLVSELSTTIVDRTGLEGLFDFVVEYDSPSPLPGLLPRKTLDPNSTDGPVLPLQHAIERQLGLKLEPVEGPMPIVVIDAAQRPTAN